MQSIIAPLYKKKLAFVVCDISEFDHVKSTLSMLAKKEFDVILTSKYKEIEYKQDRQKLLAECRSIGVRVLDFKVAVSLGQIYQYVVSTNPVEGWVSELEIKSREQKNLMLKNQIYWMFNRRVKYEIEPSLRTWLPLQLGKTQIRLLYGSDHSLSWSLQNWNSIYDKFLVHGKQDLALFEKNFGGEIFVMGYPKYDCVFDESLSVDEIKAKIGFDNAKPMVLWMPTLGQGASSIPHFAEALSKLRNAANVLVRPHPLSFIQEPEKIELLEKFNYTIDRDGLRPLAELYLAADLVVADYGGSAFSAVFCRKNLVFLDVPDGDKIPINDGSTVIKLRDKFPVLTVEDIPNLIDLISNTNSRMSNLKLVDEAFIEIFDCERGNSTVNLTKFLRDLP